MPNAAYNRPVAMLPELDPLPHRIVSGLAKGALQCRTRPWRREGVDGDGPLQREILYAIAYQRAVTPTALAEQLSIAPPTVSAVLHRLVRARLIRAVSSPSDRRLRQFVLTREGRRRAEDAGDPREQWKALVRRALKTLSVHEREQLTVHLSKVLDSVAAPSTPPKRRSPSARRPLRGRPLSSGTGKHCG